MSKKITLDTTASLVMQWAMPLYKESAVINDFFSHFDLSSGDQLKELCEKHTKLGFEVLKGRKFWVYETISQLLSSSLEQYQVVFLAAGKSPISLQLLMNYSDKLSGIFEVDLEDLTEKMSVYKKVAPQVDFSKLHSFTYNITDATFYDELKKHSYRDDLPTIIILEGITYYLLPEHLKAIVKNFSHKGNENTLIYDFLFPQEEKTSLSKQILSIFDIIKDYCKLPFITSYEREDLERLLVDDIASSDYLHLHDIEKARTGKNEFFNTKETEIIDFVTTKLK